MKYNCSAMKLTVQHFIIIHQAISFHIRYFGQDNEASLH